MATGRSFKSLVGRRRRVDEEGEDEEGPVLVEDSQSEGPTLSDVEDEEDDTDARSFGGLSAVEGAVDPTQQQVEGVTNRPKTVDKKSRKGKKKGPKKAGTQQAAEASSQSQSTNFKTSVDTEAMMMGGLKLGEHMAVQEVIDFESMDQNNSTAMSTIPQTDPTAAPRNGHAQFPAERQRRENDDCKKKRDADPAFIPNRGQFFMHDTRSYADRGQPQIRGGWNTRGRGRGVPNAGAPFPQTAQVNQTERAAQQPWKHDLHDTINEEPTSSLNPKADSPQDRSDSIRLFSKPATNHHAQQSRAISFSSTTLVGKVQIRVSLPGMKAPITFSEVPWKQYTRLPNHRPPLRRDKPVRVFLPNVTQRYIFPSSERSFIFIPRQMRPSQQGFGRNAHQRSIGGYGYSSRRTSMYGGSMYAASIAASRRSSFASVARESAFSPVGAFGGPMPPTRPVVRLPHGPHSHYSATSTPMGPLSGHQTPTGFQIHTFPLPQQPTFQGTPTTTMHQPRPQKAISVTGIESPAALQRAPSHQEIQPFQNQLPAHIHDQTGFNQPQLPFVPYNYPQQQQPQAGTPLSGIPEQAIHAPSFQPPVMPYGGAPYYGMYPPQQTYYYPPAGASGYPVMQPMYAPPPQNYMISPPAPSMPPTQTTPHQHPPSRPADDGQQQQQQQASQPQSQSGMVAHESNGMVFYIPASEAPQQSQGSESYQPAESFVPSYAMPGLPPPTPAPDATYFYPQQMAMGAPSPYYPVPGQP